MKKGYLIGQITITDPENINNTPPNRKHN